MMSKRPGTKTTKKQIVDWGQRNIDECGYGVDAAQMDTHCWRCGYKRHTETCHVIPYALGGEDSPYNYRLFCHDCHLEQPNVNDYDATDKWVRETNVGMYESFWKIREIFASLWHDVTNHWGEKLNNSTKEWLAKEFTKRLSANNIHIDSIKKIEGCLR